MTDTISSFTTRYFQKTIETNQYSSFVLGADVGGTRTNIAVAGINDNQPSLLFSLDFQTKKLSSLLPALQQTLQFAEEEYNIQIKIGCIGAAGIVSADHRYVSLTNASWDIDTKLLLEETAMESLFILNDFQVLGYGLNTVDVTDEKQVICINKPKIENEKKTRVLLGAGTGLGKSILRYDQQHDMYHASESEGGHVDIPVFNDDELSVINAIRQRNHPHIPVCYEDVLSGDGIADMYRYLRSTHRFPENQYSQQIDSVEEKAELISKFRAKDDCCRETFRLFQIFFARCAKNLALEALAGGGVFIAGGIAQKNSDVINSAEFHHEFLKNYKRKEFLQKISVFLLTDYYLSLKGACFVAANSSIIFQRQ